ncbi:MAG: hypothetical protein GQ531_06880 [Sulfurovum sp.]|nr:hypothetical protein [Sulfurovum sp.]
MKLFFSFFILLTFSTSLLFSSDKRCKRPDFISSLSVENSLKTLKTLQDVRRNYAALKHLCVDVINFKEGKYSWKMLLVTHPKVPKGPFWFLPHDNENEAFDAGVYATRKYGGGFLAVLSDGGRYFQGQDPNRNFGDTSAVAGHCANQSHPAPKYGKTIFSIINFYKRRGLPYLALHNNTNAGGISILKSSASVRSFPAHRDIADGKGLRDEDSLVYIAGKSKTPNTSKLNRLLGEGLNTRYELVNGQTNDCSLSNYVILNRNTERYYNIETQHGDLKTQKEMIDILLKSL